MPERVSVKARALAACFLSVRVTMLEGRATTLDLSENPHEEKTLMHLLRDLTAKWGHRFTI